jgi:hypothetical protein
MMIRKRVGHVWVGGQTYLASLWNPAKGLDMSDLTGDFDGRVDFDILYFTNSPNLSPLIVWSS